MTSTIAIPDLLGTAPADLIDRVADQPVATRDVAVLRAERIRTGVASYAAMRQDIADAYACRDWLALDYDSWHTYVQGEFGDELRALGRDERREAVRDLRTQGMSTRQIASATGVSDMQVRRDLAQVRPDVAPSAVTGADGKQYPATRPAVDVPATEFPIVLVAQEYGEPLQAELREERPGNPDVVKVVYLRSRTAAWIKRSRIIDQVHPLAGVGEQYVRPVPQSPQEGVNGGGGVTRDAGTAAAPRPDDKPERPCGAKQPHPAHEGDYRCPGVPAEQPSEPERPRPPAWDPEERRQHEAEVQRIRDIEAARRTADTIVTTVRAAVVTVVSGSRYGERGLVTRQMIADLRAAIDLLEKEVDGED